MSAKIRYRDEPLGRLRVVRDFLLRPEDLVFRDQGVKITIALSRRSIEFLKTRGLSPRAQRGRAPGRRVPVEEEGGG